MAPIIVAGIQIDSMFIFVPYAKECYYVYYVSKLTSFLFPIIIFQVLSNIILTYVLIKSKKYSRIILLSQIAINLLILALAIKLAFDYSFKGAVCN